MYEQRFNPYGSNIAIVKGYFRSGKVLTLGIFYIISAVIGLISVLTQPSVNYTYSVIRIFDELNINLPYEVTRSLETSSAYANISTVITSVVVPLLIAVAFILIFALSRTSSETTTPGAGLMILYILSVIALVSTIIVVVAFALIYAVIAVALFKYTGSSSSAYGSDVSTAARISVIILGVVLVIGCFLAILYAVMRKNFYRSARRSLSSVELENKGAVGYGVFCIIFAVVQVAFSLLLMGVSATALNAAGYSSSAVTGVTARAAPTIVSVLAGIALSGLLQILQYIFTAILAIGYGKYINRQKYSYNPPYGGSGGSSDPYRNYPQGGQHHFDNFVDNRPSNFYGDSYNSYR